MNSSQQLPEDEKVIDLSTLAITRQLSDQPSTSRVCMSKKSISPVLVSALIAAMAAGGIIYMAIHKSLIDNQIDEATLKKYNDFHVYKREKTHEGLLGICGADRPLAKVCDWRKVLDQFMPGQPNVTETMRLLSFLCGSEARILCLSPLGFGHIDMSPVPGILLTAGLTISSIILLAAMCTFIGSCVSYVIDKEETRPLITNTDSKVSGCCDALFKRKATPQLDLEVDAESRLAANPI